MNAFRIVWLAFALIAPLLAGCASTSFVKDILEEPGLDLSITGVDVSGGWSSNGHGIHVDIYAEADSSLYEPNLILELTCAAKICSAITRDVRIAEWDFLHIIYTNRYRNMDRVNGAAVVTLLRESLSALHEKNPPASEYPQHWRFVEGFKSQPGAKQLLSW